MIALIIAGVLVLLAGWVLLSPLVLKIDSYNSIYYVELKSLFRISLETSEGLPQNVRLRILFFEKQLTKPSKEKTEKRKKKKLEKKKKKQEKKEKKGRKEKKHRKKKGAGFYVTEMQRVAPIIFRFIKELLASFRIRKFACDFDTGDYPLNAVLIPVAAFANRENISIRINFQDAYGILLIIDNSIGKILYIIIKYIFKIKPLRFIK